MTGTGSGTLGDSADFNLGGGTYTSSVRQSSLSAHPGYQGLTLIHISSQPELLLSLKPQTHPTKVLMFD